MKSLLVLLMLVCTSCGSLKLSPQACRSPGYWGSNNDPKEEGEQELKFTEDYYVLTVDREVRLRDFLKERGVACEEVKKIRVQMSSVFFVKRVLNVFITK